MKATLWRIEYCGNSAGYYHNIWCATEEDIKVSQDYLKEEGYRVVEYPTGLCFEMTAPQKIEVELTPEGLLTFAQNFGGVTDD